jgi:hypothetical protein
MVKRSNNKNDMFLRAVGKKSKKIHKKYKKKSKHTKKLSKKSREIIDIPFSKYKSLGTRATLGKIEFHYQEYRNIKNFFQYLNFDVYYDNPILHLFARNNAVNYVSIPDLVLDKKFNIIIINLNTIEGNHANIALVNNINNTIEFFEPHGYRKNKQSEIADIKAVYSKKNKVLKDIFIDLLPNHSFIDVVSMNKKTSFQVNLDPDENTGFCVTWCILFVHYRLLNQNILLSRLIKHIDKIMSTNKLLKYAKYVEDTIKQKI